MSAQAVRQIVREVYPAIVHPVVMTNEDFRIVYASSNVCRMAWAFDVQEQSRSEDDALLMLDLTIESTGR